MDSLREFDGATRASWPQASSYIVFTKDSIENQVYFKTISNPLVALQNLYYGPSKVYVKCIKMRLWPTWPEARILENIVKVGFKIYQNASFSATITNFYKLLVYLESL